MSKICATCGTTTDDDAETFCAECGGDFAVPGTTPSHESANAADHGRAVAPEPGPAGPAAAGGNLDELFEPDRSAADTSGSADAVTPAQAGAPAGGDGTWRLIPKQAGSTLDAQAMPMRGPRLLVGRYDEETGPVDIDLTDMPGGETVSRSHAILDYADGRWHVSVAGGANGVFVRRAGEDRFSGKITDRTPLGDGDEIGCGRAILLLRLG